MYRVYWDIYDGKNGFPNIVAAMTSHEVIAKSYHKAIVKVADNNQIFIESMGLPKDGKNINDTKYREYEVRYKYSGASETAEKRIRVYNLKED